MVKVLIVLLKDLLTRKNHKLITLCEIFLPVSVVILLNCTDFTLHSLPSHKECTNHKLVCNWSNINTVYTIYYEPKNNFSVQTMKEVKCTGGFTDVRPGSIDGQDTTWDAGVKFKGMNNQNQEIPDSLKYELFPTINFWQDPSELWEDPTYRRYSYASGPLHKFLLLHHLIHNTFLLMTGVNPPTISFENMDLTETSPDLYSLFIMGAFLFGFSLMIPGVVGRLVQEKLTGAKELVLIMGLKRSHLWLAKFLECFIFFGLVQMLFILFLYVPMMPISHVLSTVPPGLTFAFLMYAQCGIIVFLFFISCFFTNPTLAVFITEIIWVLSALMYVITSAFDYAIPRTVWLMCCLLPHFCFFNGVSLLLKFDQYGKTVNVKEVLSMYPSYLSLLDVLVMFGFDILLYSALTLYLEQVKPGKYGIPKPYLFCFKTSYWFPRRLTPLNSHEVRRSSSTCDDYDCETVPARAKVGISIRNLVKEYSSLVEGSVLAVDNISIDFYSGEISGLLGHNGAGKTTVFSVISGMTYPSSGTVIINDFDITVNSEEARSSLGFCPQYDMLFNDLNVRQILCFCGLIKGLSMRNALREAKEYIEMLKLTSVKGTLAGKLSGGQKRKVSLAIALIGGSKVILLDEPTSGLDPEIRREIWEIILRFRGPRTILLTTHFMEEADVLCDRIAIMDHGKIQCYGSPMYLKSKYGSGYTLDVVINHTDKANEMKEIVQRYVKTAKFKSQNILTLKFQLSEEEIPNFPSLFSALSDMHSSQEIHSYSVSFSTFEDVFIRLRENERQGDECIDVVDNTEYRALTCSEEELPKVSNWLLPLYQFYALFIKKLIYFQRNLDLYIVFSLLPLAIIFFKLVVFPFVVDELPVPGGGDKTVFSYSLSEYKDSLVLYSSPEGRLPEIFHDHVARLGLEARRVDSVGEEMKKIFKEDYFTFVRKLILAVEFNKSKAGDIHVHYNDRAVHAMPVSINAIYNSLFAANQLKNSIHATVNMTYSDREATNLQTFRKASKPTSACSLADLPDFIGLQTVIYLIGPIKEKHFGSKHLQLMTTSTVIYWISHLAFDVISFLVYLVLTCLLIGVSNHDAMYMDHIGELALGLTLWGIGLILLSYLTSTISNNVVVAAAYHISFFFLFNSVVYYLLRWELWPLELQYLYPSCILKLGFYDICLEEKGTYKTDLLIYDIVIFVAIIMIDSHILSIVAHRLISFVVCVNYTPRKEKNSAVEDHEESVNHLISQKEFSVNSLIVNGLKRWYLNGLRPRAAVKGISFAVDSGECFGLLGVNGAGKSTTFKMMTCAITASHGDAFVNGCHLYSAVQISKGLRLIGYCPQSGGIIPTFKGRELLALFARLRGVRESHIRRETSKWVDELELSEYADTDIENYSGGNQRKLLFGMALIANTRVICLDEPTSGVDPVTRRLIWKAISNLRHEGKSVLLTSHSMDECEAVCTRLAIMVKGHFCCLGEITTLKETFGQGVTVQLKINPDAITEDSTAIHNAMLTAFGPNCVLADEHMTTREYRINDKNIKWDKLFIELIDMKSRFPMLESFNATATTLEQIFLSFARNQ